MTAPSGLCHGPGCTREQTVPFWCSALCQGRWDRGCEPDCRCGDCRNEMSAAQWNAGASVRVGQTVRAGDLDPLLLSALHSFTEVNVRPFQEAIGWLYRLMYRREIRERRERMAAFADEMQRRVDASQARAEAEDARLKAFLVDLKQAKTGEQVLALLDEWRSR